MVRNRSRPSHHELGDLLGGELSTQGDAAAARSHLSAARAHCESYGENYLAAEMDRLEALLLQREGATTDLTELCLAKALRVGGVVRRERSRGLAASSSFSSRARRSRGWSSDHSTSHLVGCKLDFRVEVPGELLHRAVARETRHVQRRHLGVARTSHDTRYELLADAAATPARLDAEGRFHGRASSAFGAAFFRGAARHASSEDLYKQS